MYAVFLPARPLQRTIVYAQCRNSHHTHSNPFLKNYTRHITYVRRRVSRCNGVLNTQWHPAVSTGRSRSIAVERRNLSLASFHYFQKNHKSHGATYSCHCSQDDRVCEIPKFLSYTLEFFPEKSHTARSDMFVSSRL